MGLSVASNLTSTVLPVFVFVLQLLFNTESSFVMIYVKIQDSEACKSGFWFSYGKIHHSRVLSFSWSIFVFIGSLRIGTLGTSTSFG